MPTYVVRRLLALIPTLFFASLIVFVTVRLIPGNVIDLMLSQNDIAVGQDRAQLEAALGLDRPMHVQYVRWVGAALQGDLGRSLWQSTPVTTQLLERLPVTFELGLLALTIALCVALPIGVYSAIRQDTAGDYLTRSFSILMLAIPGFWLGTLVMVPAIILGTSLSAVTMRLTRTMMLEVLRQDYIRTAWAKGLSEGPVVTRHALRNALIPVVTLIGLQAPLLIGGAVIMEQIFVIPGMGLLLLEAVGQRDYPIITGVFLVLGVCVMLVNLLVDLSYGTLDPRVRYRG
jgi:peptide/nickel transport system permease protein